MCKTEFYRVWKIACKDVHVSMILKSLWKQWDRFLYMGHLGTKTSFTFVKCISNWPQYSLQNVYLTVIFCKKCFPTLFNISKTIIAVRKVREFFVDGTLKNIKLLQFCKIHLGLITIFSAKQWLKHAISAKIFLLVVFFIFSLFCSFDYFTFTFRQNSLLVKVFSFLFIILLPL